MFLMELSVQIFVTNSVPVTYIQRRNVKIVSQDSIAAVAALRTLTTSMEQLMIPMI